CREISSIQTHLDAISLFAAFTISFEVRPYFVINSLYSPDSPKVSLTPTIEIGTGYEIDDASATALPSPPIIFGASEVMIPPVFLDRKSVVSASRGLRV